MRTKILTNTKTFFCEEKLHKVNYDTSRQHASFFNFLPIFSSENDCDVVNLSKSYLHKYARKIENIFVNKTEPWRYEQEWRIIEINFAQTEHSEERIRHYPINAVVQYILKCEPQTMLKNVFTIFIKKSGKIFPTTTVCLQMEEN